MPIKKEHHKRILQFLDKFGEVKAQGIGKPSEEVQQLVACTRNPLTVTNLTEIVKLATATAQEVHISANGKRIFITFS